MAVLNASSWIYNFNGYIDAEKTWIGPHDLLSTLAYYEFTTGQRYDIGLTITARNGPNILFNNTASAMLDAETGGHTGNQIHHRYSATVDPGIY